MAYQHFFTSVPDLARENRTILWARSAGIWIGLAVASLIFTQAVAINIPYIGVVIEGVLAWGGVLWAVLSLISIVYTLHRLHIEKIVSDALVEDRKTRAQRRAANQTTLEQ